MINRMSPNQCNFFSKGSSQAGEQPSDDQTIGSAKFTSLCHGISIPKAIGLKITCHCMLVCDVYEQWGKRSKQPSTRCRPCSIQSSKQYVLVLAHKIRYEKPPSSTNRHGPPTTPHLQSVFASSVVWYCSM